MRRFIARSFLAGSVLALGCAPDVPNTPPPTVVVARFDPQASPPDVPLPNDLARDPKTGLLVIPDAPMASPAQLEFNSYLRTLDGFPPGTPITANFTGAIDPQSATVSTVAKPGAIFFYDVKTKTPLGPDDYTPMVSADGMTLTIVPKKPLHLGDTYAVAVYGGSDPVGLKSSDGKQVVASPFTFFERSTAPLLTQCADITKPECACVADKTTGAYGSSCVPALGLSLAQATLLEGLRVQADATLTSLEGVDGGHKRSDLVMYWSFSLATGPFAVFDPTVGKVPFPNDVLLDQATMKVNLPMGQVPEAIRTGLNKLDGFSTTGDITLNVDTADDKAPINFTEDQSVILFNVGSPIHQPKYSVQGELENGVTYDGLVTIKPNTSLLPDRDLYVVVFTNGVTDTAGNPLRPSPIMQLIKSHSPLYDPMAKASLVPQEVADAATAQQLESLRLAFDNPTDASMNLWTQLGKLKGVNRADVAMVWAFHTQSMTQDLVSIAKYPGDKSLPTDVTIVDVEPAAGKLFGPTPDVGNVVYGKLHTHLALDASGTLDLAGGKDADIEFLMTTPTPAKTPMSGAPIAIVQHGFSRWRGDARYIAQAFAAQGWATIAIDINFHGGRSICTADSQCDSGGKCGADGTCSTKLVVACSADEQCTMGGSCGKNTGACSSGLASDSSLCMSHMENGAPVVECNPVASSAGFTNFANLFATRDNFRQHVLDLSQVQRVLAGADLKAKLAVKGIKIDNTHTAYIGQSLGGIEGTLFMAASSAPTTAVLNVPGGRVPDIIANSPTFGGLLTPLLAANNVTKDSRQYFQLLNILRWIIDPADPINFGRYLNGFGALAGSKNVIVQEAGADMVIPNPYTEALATEIGLPFVDGHVAGKGADFSVQPTFFPGAAHGFIFSYPPGTGTDSGQKQAVDWIVADGATITAP
jgi:hypothetical protein